MQELGVGVHVWRQQIVIKANAKPSFELSDFKQLGPLGLPSGLEGAAMYYVFYGTLATGEIARPDHRIVAHPLKRKSSDRL